MTSSELIPDNFVYQALLHNGWTSMNSHEGRLMLTELAVKANAGSYNSHTEEGFLSEFDLLKKDRTLNKFGRQFICSMLYKHSNNKSDFVRHSETYRN